MDLPPNTVGNIIRKYKKFGEGISNIPRTGIPKKLSERNSRWISRKVQKIAFIIFSNIQTDLEGMGLT